MFVAMYHPDIPSTTIKPVEVALQSVDDHAARGWLLVDPDEELPTPATPYYTTAAADSRFVRDTQLGTKTADLVTAGTGALPVALRAASGTFTGDRKYTGTVDFTEAELLGVEAGGGGGTGITAGVEAGQIPIWDGNSWEPQTPTDVTAADVPFTPTGNIAATNVQAAIAEVAAEAGAGGGGAAVLSRNPNPVASGLKGWAFDPIYLTGVQSAGSVGTLYLTKIPTPDAVTLNEILLVIGTTTGVGVTGFYASIIRPDGTVAASSADQAAAVNAAVAGALVPLPLTAPAAVGGGGAADFVYAAFGYTGSTTNPGWAAAGGAAASNTALNAGLTVGTYRHAQIAGTTFPLGTSVNLATQVQQAANRNLWAAVR